MYRAISSTHGATFSQRFSSTTDCADEGELSRQGLFLLGKMARDVLYYHLSGNTYITFTIDD